MRSTLKKGLKSLNGNNSSLKEVCGEKNDGLRFWRPGGGKRGKPYLLFVWCSSHCNFSAAKAEQK